MPTPRGKAVKGEGIVRGLRLEPELARALRAYAERQGEAHGTRPNMAAAARDLMRRGLELCQGEHLCSREGYYAGIAEAKRKIAEASQ